MSEESKIIVLPATVRHRELEERVRTTFAAMMDNLLTAIAGRAHLDLELIVGFLEAHAAGEAESIDPKGIAVRMFDFSRRPNRA